MLSAVVLLPLLGWIQGWELGLQFQDLSSSSQSSMNRAKKSFFEDLK